MPGHTILIEPEQLAALTARDDCAILDCRFELSRPQWGAQAYMEGHVPGALYAHLDRDLSAPTSPLSGRHPLPDPATFAQTLGRWGIDSNVQVIAYDQGPGMYAARLWWMLRWVGHERVAVLNGGLAAWSRAGLRLTSEVRPREPRQFDWGAGRVSACSSAQVLAALGHGSMRLVDARGADRFAGQNETIDPVAGHIPGAVNHPFTSNVGADGRFLAPEALRERWLGTLGGVPPERVVSMCGSGVSACHNLLALEHAGLPGARLYPGSWSEWIRDPSRPLTTGPNP